MRISVFFTFCSEVFTVINQKLYKSVRKLYLTSLFYIIVLLVSGQTPYKLNNEKIDGYRGIWFELNQKLEYGDKYSGGLGTYTADHIPMAIYSPEVNKTFFVYGGTTQKDEKHLLAMTGVFDHSTGMVSKPTVVCDKGNVTDPHDNPSMMIDDNGYIHVFVSGRGNARKGLKYVSLKPYNIDGFRLISEEIFAYPQIWNTKYGFFHFFTKYTGLRELYFETSTDGVSWTEDKKIAGIRGKPEELGGHYQVSNCFEGKVMGTFFNRHRNGEADKRTDLYYLQTKDFGKTWSAANNKEVAIPLSEVDNPAKVIGYFSQGKYVYIHDMGFDAAGNPVCLYITSKGFAPGPANAPYEWRITRWNGSEWVTSVVCESDHNYDMGSLYITDKIWRIIGPTEIGPRKYATGGELAIWTSADLGKTWKRERILTHNSLTNNSYVRRPLMAKAPFCYFWANGNPDKLSISELFFGDFEGRIWKLPYDMKNDFEYPAEIRFISN
jgi:hypothetical protein